MSLNWDAYNMLTGVSGKMNNAGRNLCQRAHLVNQSTSLPRLAGQQLTEQTSLSFGLGLRLGLGSGPGAGFGARA